MKRKIASILICTAMLSATAIGHAAAAMDRFVPVRTYAGQFQDVSDHSWYAPYVSHAFSLDLISGTSANKFSPQSKITYAQVITLAARVHAKYYEQVIPSTGGDWYAPYVQYAVQNQIVGDGFLAETELGSTVITRLNAAWILFCALPAEAYDTVNEIQKNQLPDLDDTVDGAQAVYAMYAAGILSGNDAFGTFAPSSGITRAEVSAILVRMVDRDGMRPIGSFMGSDQHTSVDIYSIPQAELNPWMEYYYGVNTTNTTAAAGLYKNGVYMAEGSQGFIGDEIQLRHVYSINDNTFYTEFDRYSESESTYSGPGYAVLHWVDDHYQIFELGFDTPTISNEHFAGYIGNS